MNEFCVQEWKVVLRTKAAQSACTAGRQVCLPAKQNASTMDTGAFCRRIRVLVDKDFGMVVTSINSGKKFCSLCHHTG